MSIGSRATRVHDIVPTGLPFGSVRWGAHLCHFYRTREELEEIVLPFFEAGVSNHEKCIWIANSQLPADRARVLFANRHPDLEARIGDGQVAIIDRDDWLARTGVLDNERRIEHWLEGERVALADGFSGLRITGDTSWIEADAWRELALHEARLHRALHGRRITALCSYQLDRCGPHEIIDVLRNHKSALMRRNGVWEHVGSATAALAFAAAPAPHKTHTVEFFEQEDFPAASMARRLVDALQQNHGALALCDREHLAQVSAAIARRMDASEYLAKGQLLLFDADTMFAETTEALDFEAAIELALGVPVRTLVETHGKARIYAELVDVCCKEGRRDLAVRLERWWNRLLERQTVELHCGYTVTSFDDAQSMHDFRAVCDEHAHVFARNQIGAADPNRLAAELQQISSILEVEAAKRVAAESDALVSREHLIELQRITSALGEAVTFDNLGSIVTAEIARAVGAARIGFVIGGQLITLRGITTPEDTTTIAQLIEHVPAQWSAGDELPLELAWIGGPLIAVLPLVFAHDRIGTLLLGFDRDEITVAERALTDDLVRQLSLSVERARVYEQAMQDRVLAERASAARDQFLAMLGHELRNPLSPILSATQLMRLRAPEQLVKERTTIERSTTRMIRLVDDLLDVAQIARGEITLAREPTELCDVVEEAVEAARAVIDDRMRFAVAVPGGLIADMDRGRMRQVIVNLIVNAAKSGDEADAGIEIAARAAGESIELVLHDEGNGIDPELLPHVFELFVQARQGLDRGRGGLGIGLPIARSIVELHAGTITVTSEGEGTGTTFTIVLPRWQVSRNTDRIAIPPPLGARRILVVDDNEDAAWLLAEALRILGHEVRCTHDGISALALAREWVPEIALLDIGLPGMNGFELCRELGKLPNRPYTIAVSGYGQPRDRALAREAGFDAHFVKPVDLRDVQTAIEALSQSN